MEVWLIKRSTMGGSSFIEDAYLDKGAARLVCEDLKEEWVGFDPVRRTGEKISKNRVIVDGHVYNIIELDSIAIHKKRALKKLTKDERQALGV